MTHQTVTIFKPYSFRQGQKIRIEGSKRSGDWEVIDTTDRKVILRCPVSKKQFEWDLFCYYVKDEDKAVWPQKD
ncbi:MAG: hypothetical protein JSW20_12645 [Nitrospiraceae bacterium]|nr:MAG: hypothetical protein JSW20_12645 [Nitrospiraceae bacterium]